MQTCRSIRCVSLCIHPCSFYYSICFSCVVVVVVLVSKIFESAFERMREGGRRRRWWRRRRRSGNRAVVRFKTSARALGLTTPPRNRWRRWQKLMTKRHIFCRLLLRLNCQEFEKMTSAEVFALAFERGAMSILRMNIDYTALCYNNTRRYR